MFALIKITCFIVIFWAAFDITVRIKSTIGSIIDKGLTSMKGTK